MVPPAASSSPSPPIDGEVFRRVLSRFPTGVVAVTGVVDGEAAGFAVGSFMSVSLDPPLVAFGVARSSSTWPRIRPSGSFCVNVLSEEQEALCRTFAAKGSDRFRDVDWVPAPTGSPIIHGCLAWIDCELTDQHRAGDHDLVVGQVRDLGARDTSPGPLLFFARQFGGFRPLARTGS
ncbi:flavin reductase family protein [Pseudonocardia thermophila]|uniref:flavin reductase family protein n=1 Tax=Pseudonocardia thermophila TaxID=1848 RepID=UPI00248F3F40|nr:flavin reductase family protein [Pseudonocardia thermophila]